MRSILTIACLWAGAAGLCGQSTYPFYTIPPQLLKNANVVVRKNELRFEVKDQGQAVETEHKVLTILNTQGALKQGQLEFQYSRFIKIDDIEAAVYDAEGKLVRKLKSRDIQDVKPPEYFVEDYRIKKIELPVRSFPYTLEYTVTRKFVGLLFYPDFQPQESPDEAVEYARFEVVMPPDLKARFKEINIQASWKKGAMLWEFSNMPAFTPEPFSPSVDPYFPKILAAPTLFTFGGIAGDMHSWESIGAFIRKLNETQEELPVETQTKLRNLVADCGDPICKIRRVYDYLQSNTRYFLVSLGIGGWQPAPASEVDRFKYGDCKGLSNYTVSMLKAAGVPAFYTLVHASSHAQQIQSPDFPSARFNHVIVCVPLAKDTIWLECTSQTISCGFLSDFTDNRPALLITPEGGKLVRTPAYDETQNVTVRHTTISLAADGNAVVQSKGTFKGIAQDIQAELAVSSEEFQKKYLYKTLPVNDFEIRQMKFNRRYDRLPVVEQDLSLLLPHMGAVSGKRLFLPLRLLSGKIDVPATDSLRHFDIQADARGFTEEDSIAITLPEGYRLENEFTPVESETAFGRFEMSVQSEPGRIMVHRKLQLNSRVFPKEIYPKFVSFLTVVAKADKTKLVLVKQG